MLRNVLHNETPCIRSTALSMLAERDVYLKLENCQPTGSFKLRGIGSLCSVAKNEGAKRFISSSGGNAGVAAAHAGRILGIPVKVFLPESTPDFMMNKIEAEGAVVQVGGKDWNEANEAALREIEVSDGFYIPPFDHPEIWRGHSTIVDEIKRQTEKPALITVAVGGGGLLCGILEGLSRHAWGDVPILACESEGTASFAATLKVKKLVTLSTVSGIATSLGARCVTKKIVDWIGIHPMSSFVTSDEILKKSVVSFLDDHRFLVEPSCAAALAPIYQKQFLVEGKGPILVIVCGGAVINSQNQGQQNFPDF